MTERWHADTSSFHLPVGEMTITLDDVACLLNIPISGRLIHQDAVDRDDGIDMLVEHLLFEEEDAAHELRSGVSISITSLKLQYEQLLGRCNALMHPTTPEELQEQELVRPACVKAFLLLLVGLTLFANKNSKSIELLPLYGFMDLEDLEGWAWGAMGLAYLYEQLNLTNSSTVGSCGGFMSLLMGWVFAHFPSIIPRTDNEDYDPTVTPLTGLWTPNRGFKKLSGYRLSLDTLEYGAVEWRPYENYRDMTPFQDICWYSGWIMVGRQRRVRHLPERVLRQYGYVQTIPRSPRDVLYLEPEDVAVAFVEHALHVVGLQDRGRQVPPTQPYLHAKGYMKWFLRVSHPVLCPPAAVPTHDAPRPLPPYEEVLVEQQWARQPPDPYQVISNIRARVESVMQHPDVLNNPQLFGMMQLIQGEYSGIEEMPIPRRRSRSPRE